MSILLQMALAVGVYFAVSTTLGVLASRSSSRSPEEFFLAGRGLGTAVLFMALFGTNCTSFVLVGIPGLSYQLGIGVFGLNAAIVALGVPLSFWILGVPARAMARRLGALTPAELYAQRLDSRAVGTALFAAYTVYTIPYMVQGVKGAALVLSSASEGRVAPWVASLFVLATVIVYTSLGGMRGTAWTNVFQGFLFLLFMVSAFFLVARSLGGFAAATAGVAAEGEHLLVAERSVPLFAPRRYASWGLVISTTVIAFPHMFVRLMAARSEEAIAKVVRLYPLALVALWVPAVCLGFWGRGAFPELGPDDADRIFSLLTATHLPAALGVLAYLAVLAAVMSTLDAQLLTLSSMLLRDGVEPLARRLGLDASGIARAEVSLGRAFTLAVALVVYALSLTWGDSVFDISRKAFEGYTTLVPALFLGLWWRRFTAAGAIVSLVLGNAVLLLGWGLDPGARVWLGFLPVFGAFLAAFAAGVLTSLATRAPAPGVVETAFGRPT